jgi:predicted CoA-binding protein
MSDECKTVVVVGASPNPARYSNKAVAELKRQGYKVIPVHPAAEEIHGIPVVSSLEDITEPVDTVTLYINATQSQNLVDTLELLAPRRVLFNPGAENDSLMKQLELGGIEVHEFCTLVLLSTGQF